MLSVYLQVQYFPQNLFIMLLAICQLHNSFNTYSELTCACSDKFKNWSGWDIFIYHDRRFRDISVQCIHDLCSSISHVLNEKILRASTGYKQ